MNAGAAVTAVLLLSVAACAVFDLRERRIPDAVVWPAIAVLVGLRLMQGEALVLESAATAAAAFVLFTVIRLASRGRLGAGDAKLAAVMGLGLGARGCLLALLVASAAGAATAGALIASGRLRRDQPLPFAPFLALGTVAALLAEPLAARLLADTPR